MGERHVHLEIAGFVMCTFVLDKTGFSKSA